MYSVYHSEQLCPGITNSLKFDCLYCKKKSHISTLCKLYKPKNQLQNNVCINSSISAEPEIIMPLMDLLINYKDQFIKVRCLLDSGSQRSYFSNSLLAKLHVDSRDIKHSKHDIKTFLGSKSKHFKNVSLNFALPQQSYITRDVLIDDNFQINLHMPTYQDAISNLLAKDIKLAVTYEGRLPPEIVQVDGLLGVDILQYLQCKGTVKCFNGVAYEYPNGLVPFGDIDTFLFPSQIDERLKHYKQQEGIFTSYNEVIHKYAHCSETHVNFVISPTHSYPDPLSPMFPESSVERNLENLFNVESLGISTTEELMSDYDAQQIANFQNSISFRDGHYEVKLPWHHDKLKHVPSNYNIALSVLDRVNKK